jgi:hypothetical protein
LASQLQKQLQQVSVKLLHKKMELLALEEQDVYDSTVKKLRQQLQNARDKQRRPN